MDADVRLYGALIGGDPDGLGAALNVKVEEGTGTVDADQTCTSFTPSGTLYDDDLVSFTTDHSNFGNGASTWAPTGGAAKVKVFRFTTTLTSSGAGLQGGDVQASFTWEAQAGS